jgi:hypothetical protein
MMAHDLALEMIHAIEDHEAAKEAEQQRKEMDGKR